MPCNCGKKVEILTDSNVDLLNVDVWGPIVWKILHFSAEKIGSYSELKFIEKENLTFMINNLHLILPCEICRQHAKSYIDSNPPHFNTPDLKDEVRIWFFNFHNSVRTFKNQPIVFNSAEDCKIYSTSTVTKKDIDTLSQSMTVAIEKNIINGSNWYLWRSKFINLASLWRHYIL